jgi:6-phosphogluconolactonase
MSNWCEAATSTDLDTALADHIGAALHKAIKARGEASLAISGGNTPKGFFQLLSHYDLDWQKVTITLVDDRWVDPAHEDSNERLAKENLLQNQAANARWLGLKTADENAQDGLAEASQRIASISKPLTVTVLGMGGDGHTASWFPEATNLQELVDPEGVASLGACDPVTAPHQRITLTLPTVLNSGEIILHIVGNDKREILATAKDKNYPVAHILEQTQTPLSTWWAPQ